MYGPVLVQSRNFVLVGQPKSLPRQTGTGASALRQTTCMSFCRQLKGLHDLPGHYKGILLDQFGVLHDGQTAYPAAVPAVKWLHEQGMKILILSNSSKTYTAVRV